jgi:hypothetical protein
MNMHDPLMNGSESDGLAAHMADVARELLGEPNKALSKPHELRYGTRGSLSINTARGLWHDHEQNYGGGVLDLICRETGCDRRGAADWMKLRGFMRDEPQPTGRSRIVATYDYRTEAGELLFQVCRMEPKDFRQRRPDGRGGWTWSTRGVRRVPYRLPELVKADPGAVVYICEGEKDADRLAKLGLVATTNPGGAGKWPDDFAGYFTGRRVAVLADNDDAGRDHAATVRDNLRRGGVQAAVLPLPDLPPKGDVSDWLERGGNVELLARMAEMPEGEAPPRQAKPPAKFALVRADLLDFNEPEYLVEGLIETETLGLMFADPGAGKTFVALDIGASVATGRPFHGRAVRKGAVVYICGEGQKGIKRRLVAWERHHGASLAGAPLYVSEVAARFLDAESIKAVVEAIDAAAAGAGVPIALIIVDTLNRNMGAGDESSAKDMSAFVAAIDDVRTRYEACAMVIHHTGHGNKERARGSMVMLGAVDCEFRIDKTGDNGLTMVNTKQKDGPNAAPIGFDLVAVEIGRMRNGEPFTSAALTEVEASAPSAGRKMPAALRLALETFLEAKKRGGTTEALHEGVTRDAWRDVFYERTPAEGKRQAFNRAATQLVTSGRLSVRDDVFTLAKVPPGFTG